MVIDCSAGACDGLLAPLVGPFIFLLVVLGLVVAGFIALGVYAWRWIGIELDPTTVRAMKIVAAGPVLAVVAVVLPPALLVTVPVLWWRFQTRAVSSGFDEDGVAGGDGAGFEDPGVGP